MRAIPITFLLTLLLWSVAGCGDDTECSDCPDTSMCTDCDDAGGSDAESPDAPVADGGREDAPATDASGVDANVADSALADGGGVDDAGIVCGVDILATSEWSSDALPRQTGSFTLRARVSVGAATTNGVFALSEGGGAAFSDFAVLVRMNPEGFFDARDGDDYRSDVEGGLAYEAGASYDIRVDVDVERHRYDVWITPDGGAEVALIDSAAFRDEQAEVTALDTWGVQAGEGAFRLTCGPSITNSDCPPAGCAPSCGDGACMGGETCNSCAADCGMCTSCGGGACLVDVDFESHPGGDYSVANMDADFGWLGDFQNGLGEGRANIVGEGDNQFLRCLFREGTRGHMQWKADLGGPHDDVWLEFRVRFVGAEFDFRSAGKIPGLAGGTHPTGGADSADGLGFSARFNWRDTNSNPRDFFTQYMYDMDKPNGSTGRHLTLGGSPIYIDPDHWYHFRQHIVMNTPGEANGIVEVWLDGTKVLDLRDARLRSRADLGVDVLYFSTFFGGSNTPTYQTTRDEYIDYDDFEVYLGP